MNCSEAREVLSHDFPSPLGPRELEAQQHLRQCERCRSYLGADLELRRRLSELEPEKPGTAFKERLFGELSKLRWQKSHQARNVKARRLAGAVILLLVIPLTWLWWQADRAPDLLDYLIEDHQQNLPGRVMMSFSSPQQIEGWFEGKLDFSLRVRVPEGAEILGARLCHIKNRRAALIFYRCRSRIISWFTFSQEAAGTAGLQPQASTSQGYNLILWPERGLTHAVVSDLEMDQLQEMIASTQLVGDY